MADYKVTDTELTSIANAIRAKTGKSSQMEFPTEFVSEIGSISGGDTDDWTTLTDYIESSGTQYIDTGYICNDNTKLELIANVPSNNTENFCLYGARNGEYLHYTKAFGAYRNDDALSYFVGAGNPVDYATLAPYYNHKTKYVLSKISFGLINEDGIHMYGNHFSNVGSIDNENNLYLLSLNQNGLDFGATTHCIAKAYRFRIYEGDTLVHEFIPWLDSNDVVCLKDTVTGNLKYNAGTGAFTYGTDE